MQRTEEYETLSRVVGTDPQGALAWIRRQESWERRLRALETGPSGGTGRGARALRLVSPAGPGGTPRRDRRPDDRNRRGRASDATRGAADDEGPTRPEHARRGISDRSTRRAVRR
jgi:hypothetical protein